MAGAREAVLCLLGLALVAPYSECTVFGYHNYSTEVGPINDLLDLILECLEEQDELAADVLVGKERNLTLTEVKADEATSTLIARQSAVSEATAAERRARARLEAQEDELRKDLACFQAELIFVENARSALRNLESTSQNGNQALLESVSARATRPKNAGAKRPRQFSFLTRPYGETTDTVHRAIQTLEDGILRKQTTIAGALEGLMSNVSAAERIRDAASGAAVVASLRAQEADARHAVAKREFNDLNTSNAESSQIRAHIAMIRRELQALQDLPAPEALDVVVASPVFPTLTGERSFALLEKFSTHLDAIRALLYEIDDRLDDDNRKDMLAKIRRHNCWDLARTEEVMHEEQAGANATILGSLELQLAEVTGKRAHVRALLSDELSGQELQRGVLQKLAELISTHLSSDNIQLNLHTEINSIALEVSRSHTEVIGRIEALIEDFEGEMQDRCVFFPFLPFRPLWINQRAGESAHPPRCGRLVQLQSRLDEHVDSIDRLMVRCNLGLSPQLTTPKKILST